MGQPLTAALPDFFDAPDEIRREVALWRRVLILALNDSAGHVFGVWGEKSSRSSQRCKIVREGKRWLRSEDFDEVCALALLDPDAVRTFARNMRKPATIEELNGHTYRRRHRSLPIVVRDEPKQERQPRKPWQPKDPIKMGAVVRRYKDGLTYRQIASEVGLSQGMVQAFVKAAHAKGLIAKMRRPATGTRS